MFKHLFRQKTIPCNSEGCTAYFKTVAGRKRHIAAVHDLEAQLRDATPDPPPIYHPDFIIPHQDNHAVNVDAGNGDGPGPNAGGVQPEDHQPIRTEVSVETHPHLTGKCPCAATHPKTHHAFEGTPCDPTGQPLPEGAPPSARPGPRNNDYGPYESRAQFQIADFLYREVQMSGNHIDKLMNLWTAYSDSSPFADHQHMYSTIDAIPLADIKWCAFVVTYTGPRPESEVPAWMEAEYMVYYRCPRQVLHAQLGNRELNGEVDYVPKKIYHGDERVLQNFMSGDWVWTQAVCDQFNYKVYPLLNTISSRMR